MSRFSSQLILASWFSSLLKDFFKNELRLVVTSGFLQGS